jgi:Protein of unknown function (DUF3618)
MRRNDDLPRRGDVRTEAAPAGGKSSDEIGRDIERTRADLDETLEAIQRKLSPGGLVDQAFGFVRSGPGPRLAAVLERNPAPGVLIGVGLAWLLAAGAGGTARRRPDAGGSAAPSGSQPSADLERPLPLVRTYETGEPAAESSATTPRSVTDQDAGRGPTTS